MRHSDAKDNESHSTCSRGTLFGLLPTILGTLSNMTPSTGRGGQSFQLINLPPGNTYRLKELATTLR